MMNNDIFTPHVEELTVVYDKDGKEIKRMNGTVIVRAAEWDEYMPIRVDYVTTTTMLTNRTVIEKGETQ